MSHWSPSMVTRAFFNSLDSATIWLQGGTRRAIRYLVVRSQNSQASSDIPDTGRTITFNQGEFILWHRYEIGSFLLQSVFHTNTKHTWSRWPMPRDWWMSQLLTELIVGCVECPVPIATNNPPAYACISYGLQDEMREERVVLMCHRVIVVQTMRTVLEYLETTTGTCSYLGYCISVLYVNSPYIISILVSKTPYTARVRCM